MRARPLLLRALPVALAAAGLVGVAGPVGAGGGGPDLEVSLSVGPAEMAVGQDATASISVDNTGPGPGQDVVLDVEVDPAFVFEVPDGCDAVPGGFSCPFGTLAPSSGVVMANLALGAAAPGTQAVSATVTSSTTDPDPSDDEGTASVEVTGEACDVVGTQGNDYSLEATPGGAVVCGFGGSDVIVDGDGDDALRGGSGEHDKVLFEDVPFGPISVDLVAGTATGHGSDILSGVEDLVGTSFADSMWGNAAANTFSGGPGPDELHGRAGDDALAGGTGGDHLDGGLGHDSVHYATAPRPVRVDLAAGTGAGQGPDTIEAVEDVDGSPYDDVLAGGSGPNTLSGETGVDVLIGRGGADSLFGGEAADTLHAGAGNDELVGGAGRDGCVQGVGTGTKQGCELVAYAQYGDLVLFEPHVDTVGFGFHESLFPSAEVLRPLGTLDLNANKGKYPNPPPPTDGPGYVVMGSRGRSTHPTSATDIVVPRNGTMRAPVSGTVVEVAIYQLYCDRPDWKVIIRPQTAKDLRVIVLHMADPHVEEGDRVVAGVTDIGVAVENDPATAQENDYFPDQYPHVHIEVEHVGAVKGPCAA